MTGILTTGAGRLRLTGDNAGFCEAILRKHNAAAPLRLESLRHVRPREDAAAEQLHQQPLVVNLLMQLRAYYDQNNTFLRSQTALHLQLTNQLRQVLSTSNGAVRARAGEIERAIRTNLYREGEFSRAMGQLTQELKKNENRPPEWTVNASRSGPAFPASGRPSGRTVSGAASGDRSQTTPSLRVFASQETGQKTAPAIQPTAIVRTPAVPTGERLQYRQDQTLPQAAGKSAIQRGKALQRPTASQPQLGTPEQLERKQKRTKQSTQPQKQPEQRVQGQAQPEKPVQPQKHPEQSVQRQTQAEKPDQPQKHSEQTVQGQTQQQKPVQPQKQPEQPVQGQTQRQKPTQPRKQAEQPVQPQTQAERQIPSPKQSEGPIRQQERVKQSARQTERADTPVRWQTPEPALQPETTSIKLAPPLEHDSHPGSGVSVSHAEPPQISMEHPQSSKLEPVYRQTSGRPEESDQTVTEHRQQPVRAVLVSPVTQNFHWMLSGELPGASAIGAAWVRQSIIWSGLERAHWHGSAGLAAPFPGNAQPLRYRFAIDHTTAIPDRLTQYRQPSMGVVPANIVQPVQYRNILQQAGMLPSVPMQYRQPSMGVVPANIVQPVQYRSTLRQVGMPPGTPMQNRQPSMGAVPANIVQPVQYRNILQRAGILPGIPMQYRHPSMGAIPANIVQPVQYRNILQPAGMLPSVPMQYRQLSMGVVPASIVQPVQYRNILQQAGILPGVPVQNRQPSTEAVPASIVQPVQYRNILQPAGMLPGVPMQNRQLSPGAVPASIVHPVQYRIKGTREALRQVIELYTGQTPLIIEQFEPASCQVWRRDGATLRRLYGGSRHTVTVLMPEAQGGADDYAKLWKIIEAFRPVDAICNLVFLRHEILLGQHCYLGMNSRIGGSRELVLDGTAASGAPHLAEFVTGGTSDEQSAI
ncbi:hypothetical protein ACTQ33_09110 [Candidatus Avoscillospira sp. LCP25S3_F1]|uniref:hypothetical protein n=1 Tax=Candidatus Avoscillospira sp. LCP25S3_F1 TaxID=3438825 RepID=UPI003F937E94